MKDTLPEGKPVTAKRQQILAKAFEQLRKSRAKVDPAILQKIRQIVGGSPELMKKLGLVDAVQEGRRAPTTEPKTAKAEDKAAFFPQGIKNSKSGYEEIDQAKNMKIMAKLMEINPSAREDIKAVIKKSGK
ncbi:MAG: hypothetical protein R3D88_01565 [Alphaproteobacteria bacterium]|nr:hypothetical protein [Alphaproteobacteria bacterium]